MPMPDWGKQYGPLPLGAWVALVGGGLAIAWWSARNRPTGQQIVEDTSGQAGVGAGAGGLWVQTQPPEGDVAKGVTTNEEWARKAINYLIAQGYDPAMADTAIRKYLESTKLSLAENALVKIALAHLGAPPVPLPIPPDLPVPPTQPPPTEPPPQQPPPSIPNVRWATVTPWPTKHSTLWGISSTYYGKGSDWPRLYNANRVGVRRPDGSLGMIKNPNLIYAGWRIYVP